MKLYIKDINFLPQRIINARQRRRSIFIYVLSSLVVFGIIGVAVWLPYRIVEHYQEQLAEVNAEVAKLEQAESYYQTMTKLQEKLDIDNKAVAHIESKQQSITELLQQINNVLPTNCTVSYLELKEKGKFTLDVVIGSPIDIAQMMVGLRNLGIFDRVDLADAGDDEKLDKGEIPFINPESVKKVRFNLILSGGDTQENGD